jgi:hypothetical protein
VARPAGARPDARLGARHARDRRPPGAIAKTLEAPATHPELVAGFLTRCLFSMFAEDVGLLPRSRLQGALQRAARHLQNNPQQFVPLLGRLWREMDSGGFSVVLRATLPRFNGKLFKQPEVIALDREQIGLLLEAANADWTQVEPAIFGTLLERALDPRERHALGAHYTPRAYVDRLVLPTVIEPLRATGQRAGRRRCCSPTKASSESRARRGRAFHHRLCQMRVLDPACGSGNFLYVTLEHLKRLEGEVLDQLHDIGHGQFPAALEAEGLTVDPHQFLGLELNPRAAADRRTGAVDRLPAMALPHATAAACRPARSSRTSATSNAATPCWPMTASKRPRRARRAGQPLGRPHDQAASGHRRPVPDECAPAAAALPQPAQAEWPQADFIVGNPPFIGASACAPRWATVMSRRCARPGKTVPESADFVMFWWHHAAQSRARGEGAALWFHHHQQPAQTFNRRVVQAALDKGIAAAFRLRPIIPGSTAPTAPPCALR